MINDLAILRKMSCMPPKDLMDLSTGMLKSIIDVEIRLNYKCNAACIMCGLRDYISVSDNNRKVELSYKEWIARILELKELGCQNITFSGGEPTIRDDIVELVYFAAQKCGMQVSLNTNGYMLDEKMCIALISAGLYSVTFSVLSPEKEINDLCMGLKNGLSHIEYAINYFKDYSKVKVFVNTVILRNNIESLINYPSWYKKNPFDYLTFSPASILVDWDEWTSRQEAIRPTIEQVLKFKDKTIPVIRNTKGLEKVIDPFEETESQIINNLCGLYERKNANCFATIFHIVIQSNGDIIPCCYAPDEYVMGNVLEKSIAQIINCDAFNEFRKKVLVNKLRMCQSCRDYYNINKIISERWKDYV